MEGFRGRVANFGVAQGQAKWRALVEADYFTIVPGDCPHSRPGRACGNYFCMECMVGGLCPAGFRTGGEHANHTCIKVWKVTGAVAVRVHDLKDAKPDRPAFMNEYQLHPLQQYFENGNLHYKLVSSGRRIFAGLKRCNGCGFSIAETETPNYATYPVCSIKCLLDFALVQRREADERLAAIRQRAAEAGPS